MPYFRGNVDLMNNTESENMATGARGERLKSDHGIWGRMSLAFECRA